MFTLVWFHCTCTSTYIVLKHHLIEYFAVTSLAQEPRDLVSALHFKVSIMIPLDPLKTVYSVA